MKKEAEEEERQKKLKQQQLFEENQRRIAQKETSGRRYSATANEKVLTGINPNQPIGEPNPNLDTLTGNGFNTQTTGFQTIQTPTSNKMSSGFSNTYRVPTQQSPISNMPQAIPSPSNSGFTTGTQLPPISPVNQQNMGFKNPYTPLMNPTPNPNFELEKITNSLKAQLSKLKHEAEVVTHERNLAAKKLESLQAELAFKQKEEDVYLKRLRNAMSNTQSLPEKKTQQYQETPQKQQDYMKIYSSKTSHYQEIADSIALDCRSNFINVRQQWLGDSNKNQDNSLSQRTKINQEKLGLLYPDNEVFNSIARKSYGQFLLAQSKRFNQNGGEHGQNPTQITS